MNPNVGPKTAKWFGWMHPRWFGEPKRSMSIWKKYLMRLKPTKMFFGHVWKEEADLLENKHINKMKNNQDFMRLLCRHTGWWFPPPTTTRSGSVHRYRFPGRLKSFDAPDPKSWWWKMWFGVSECFEVGECRAAIMGMIRVDDSLSVSFIYNYSVSVPIVSVSSSFVHVISFMFLILLSFRI